MDVNVSDEKIAELLAQLVVSETWRDQDTEDVRTWLAPILEQHVRAEIERMGKEPVAVVVNNDLRHRWHTVEAQPSITMDIGAKLYAAPPDLQAQLDAVREECAHECFGFMSVDDDISPDDLCQLLGERIRSRIGKPSPLAQLQAENAELRTALKRLTFAARTSGGTAGPDK